MRIEVTFAHTDTGARRVVTVRAISVADGLAAARILLYHELDDRQVFVKWGVVDVRTVG